MNFSIKSIAGIVLALAAGLAQATASSTLDFSSLAPGSVAGSYSEDTYTLTGALFGTAAKLEPVKGNDTLSSFGFVFTGAKNTSFDLDSFDLTNLLNGRSGGSVLLSYKVAGSSTIQFDWLTLDKTSGFELFSQNGTKSDELPKLDDLSWFSLASLGGFQVDNITVTADATTPAVPEPANLALFAAGLGLVGMMARRRKL